MNQVTIDMSSPISPADSPQKLLSCKQPLEPLDMSSVASAVIQMANESTADSQTVSCSSCQSEPAPCPTSAADLSYSEEIVQHMRRQEAKTCISVPSVGAGHAITAALRAKMVDWMIEVIYKAECTPQTLFTAVAVIDRFLAVDKQSKSGDMHMIGVVAMLLSSKLEDVAGMDVQFMYEQVVHRKIPVKEMVDCEARVFRTLAYQVASPTELDFLGMYTAMLVSPEALSQALHTATLTLHSAELAASKPSLRAAGSLLLVLNGGKTGKAAERVGKVSGYTEVEVVKAAAAVASHTQRFKELYPKLKNASTYC